MRILDRYVARRFIGPFLFGLGVFALLMFLGNLFDNMNRLTSSKAPAGILAEWLLLQLPYWAIRIIPMASLLAALFAVTEFVRSGEFIAVQASGLEARRFFRPLLWMGLLITGLSFAAQELVLPYCFSRSEHLMRDRIHPTWEWDKYIDTVLVAGADRLISSDEFIVKAGTMERPVYDQYDARGLIRQLDAEWARWDPAQAAWIFERGVERSFGPKGDVSDEKPFTTLISDLKTSPKKLRPRERRPDSMSFLETRRYVEHLRSLGQPTRRMLTGMHAKLAYPFANLILCALGIPLALMLRRAPKPVSFGVALVLSFLYMWVIELGWYLGKAGRLPPPVAAWMANVIFGGLSVVLYRRTRV